MTLLQLGGDATEHSLGVDKDCVHPSRDNILRVYIIPAASDQLRVRSRDIVFICIPYIPPQQSLPPSLPHPCQSVAGLKDSQLNVAGEIVAAYLVGNRLTPSFVHKLGSGGWG